MKDQYFGDVNDFRKYALLRSLAGSDLRLGVCWMLTEPDGRNDGGFISYLQEAHMYRHLDPPLFDLLQLAVDRENDRRVTRIEVSGLLGSGPFHTEFVNDNAQQRMQYFASFHSRASSCDLMFFDPDNGLEVKSVRPGRRRSSKYVYWNEVRAAYFAGASVLIYQHFPYLPRDKFIDKKCAELRQHTGARFMASFRTPHVVFFLASQPKHEIPFHERIESLKSHWPERQIRCNLHARDG
jgi:hypothetical protein